MRILVVPAALLAALVILLTPSTPPRVRVTRLERSREVKITGPNGAPPRYAVAPFDATDGTTGVSASLLSDVVRQDLQFESAFEIVPQPAPSTAPPAAPPSAPSPAESGINPLTRPIPDPDALIIGTLRQWGDLLDVDVRIVSVTTGEEAFARGYTGPANRPRLVAHTIADEILGGAGRRPRHFAEPTGVRVGSRRNAARARRDDPAVQGNLDVGLRRRGPGATDRRHRSPT